jgi:tRNA pseudouridine55 synthase
MYSAVKINGQKLYALARAGIEIERNSRKVTIHRIEWLYTRKNADGYPTIGYRVLCSKGTYIRTLCSDIGKQLGYPAVMSNLIRTSSGGFLREDCLTFEQIQQLLDDGKLKEHIVSTPDSVRHLPAITLDNHNVFKAMNGQHISFVDTSNSSQSTLYRVFDDQNIFLGIFQYDSTSQVLIPVKVWRGEQ